MMTILGSSLPERLGTIIIIGWGAHDIIAQFKTIKLVTRDLPWVTLASALWSCYCLNQTNCTKDMNFLMFIALFGTLAQAWFLPSPWQKADSKLFSMNCVNWWGYGIVQRSTRKKNNWLRVDQYVILETTISLGLLAVDRQSWSYVLSLFWQNTLEYYRRKFKIIKIMLGIWSNLKKKI